jgi:hypothetical protein
MKEKNKLTVTGLLSEHMLYLAEKASQQTSGSKEERFVIDAMEDIQTLMNRLDISDGDEFLDYLAESRTYLRLSYDSKVLVLANTRQVTALSVSIGKLIYTLEDNPKLAEKMRKSVSWKLFRLIARLPWGR